MLEDLNDIPPPDWSQPNAQALRARLLSQFEATLPGLLEKIDEVMPFVECMGTEGLTKRRSRVACTAYARLWGLCSSVFDFSLIIVKDPSQRVNLMDIDPIDRWVSDKVFLDMGEIILSDHGIGSMKDLFLQAPGPVKDRLNEVRKTHPQARNLGMKSCVVPGSFDFGHARGWNMESIDDYLETLVLERDLLGAGLSSLSLLKGMDFLRPGDQSGNTGKGDPS